MMSLNRICDEVNARVAYDIFQLALPGVGHILVVLAIESVIATILVLLLEVKEEDCNILCFHLCVVVFF